MEHNEVFTDFQEFCNTCFKDINGLLAGYVTKFQTRPLPDSPDQDNVTLLHVTGLVSPQGEDVELVIKCHYNGAEVNRRAWFVYLTGNETLRNTLEPAHNVLQATLRCFKFAPTPEEIVLH